jgi:hypothetical protein
VTARYSVEYYPGENNERLPEWRVVEWTFVNPETGGKAGRTRYKTYDLEGGESACEEVRMVLQEEYNMELYYGA